MPWSTVVVRGGTGSVWWAPHEPFPAPPSIRPPLVTARLADLLPDAVVEPLRDLRTRWRDAREWSRYVQSPFVPPPHVVKVRAVLDHARRHGLAVLVETGTFQGAMVRATLGSFHHIYSIELDPALAARAARRFRHSPEVRILEGDSGRRIADALAEVKGPALFWLDAHHSGGITARGERDTPLVEELDAIVRHGDPGHVVLIDDARLLGTGDYPDLEEIARRVRPMHIHGSVTVADDIVRCLPGSGS